MSRGWQIALGVALAASLAVDLLGPGKEARHVWEHETFFAWYGLLGCVAIILASKWLGKRLLQRPEDYYRRLPDAADRPPQGPAEDGSAEDPRAG